MVSGVFFVGYILDRILKRMVVVYLIFEKMLGMCVIIIMVCKIVSSERFACFWRYCHGSVCLVIHV